MYHFCNISTHALLYIKFIPYVADEKKPNKNPVCESLNPEPDIELQVSEYLTNYQKVR